MNVVIYLYHGLTTLDTVGPYKILSRLPNAQVRFIGTQKGVIVTDTHFLKLVAEYEVVESAIRPYSGHSRLHGGVCAGDEERSAAGLGSAAPRHYHLEQLLG